jgi:hypothetical protein
VVPFGVETVVFFVAEDFSEHPIAPTAITPIIKTALIMRFIFQLLGVRANSGRRVSANRPPTISVHDPSV